MGDRVGARFLERSAFEAVGNGSNERVAFVFFVCISLNLGVRRILNRTIRCGRKRERTEGESLEIRQLELRACGRRDGARRHEIGLEA